MASNDDSCEKDDSSNNEGSNYNNDYEGRNPWNTREHKTPWLIYVVVAASCLLLAYLLSGTAK